MGAPDVDEKYTEPNSHDIVSRCSDWRKACPRGACPYGGVSRCNAIGASGFFRLFEPGNCSTSSMILLLQISNARIVPIRLACTRLTMDLDLSKGRRSGRRLTQHN